MEIAAAEAAAGSGMNGFREFLTVLIAVVVAWVAIQQWKINREKLRLDLFDRRYAIFNATRTFMANIVTEGKVKHEWQAEFWRGTADAPFLFNADVVEYIDLINSRAADMHYHSQSQKTPGADLQEHIPAESKLFLWFSDELGRGGLQSKFRDYLAFQNLEGHFPSIRHLWPRRK